MLLLITMTTWEYQWIVTRWITDYSIRLHYLWILIYELLNMQIHWLIDYSLSVFVVTIIHADQQQGRMQISCSECINQLLMIVYISNVIETILGWSSTINSAYFGRPLRRVCTHCPFDSMYIGVIHYQWLQHRFMLNWPLPGTTAYASVHARLQFGAHTAAGRSSARNRPRSVHHAWRRHQVRDTGHPRCEYLLFIGLCMYARKYAVGR